MENNNETEAGTELNSGSAKVGSTNPNNTGSGELPTSRVEIFCETMRNMRIKADYSLERAALATRISLPFLQALESGDFNSLPGVVFGKGFIRGLCKAYGAENESEIVQQFDEACRELGINDPRPAFSVKEETNTVLQDTVVTKKEFFKSLARKMNPSFYFRATPLVAIQVVVVAVIGLGYYLTQPFWADQGSESGQDVAYVEPSGEVQELGAMSSNQVSAVQEDSKLGNRNSTDSEAKGPSRVDNNSVSTAETEKKLAPKDLKTSVDNRSDNSSGVQNQRLAIYFPKANNIRIILDEKKEINKAVDAGNYRWSFSDRAQVFISEPAGVRVDYNDQFIGELKEGFSYRRLAFERQPPAL